MSFSSQIKEELAKVMANYKHCRKAELAGMFQYGGRIGRVRKDCYTIGFHTENEEVLKKGFTLLKKTFSIEIDNNLSEKQLFAFLEKMDAIEQESLDNVTNRICCRRAFIRGAFLAVGSVSDPEKGYHLEFVCEEEEQAKLLTSQLISHI